MIPPPGSDRHIPGAVSGSEMQARAQNFPNLGQRGSRRGNGGTDGFNTGGSNCQEQLEVFPSSQGIVECAFIQNGFSGQQRLGYRKLGY